MARYEESKIRVTMFSVSCSIWKVRQVMVSFQRNPSDRPQSGLLQNGIYNYYLHIEVVGPARLHKLRRLRLKLVR